MGGFLIQMIDAIKKGCGKCKYNVSIEYTFYQINQQFQ